MDTELLSVVKTITRKPSERLRILRDLTLPERSAVLQELSPHVQQVLLRELTNHEITEIVDHMDPRQAENILARIKDEKRRLKIIKKVKTEAREKIEYFLRFHPKATTSLISFNYVLLPKNSTVGDAADAVVVRRPHADPERSVRAAAHPGRIDGVDGAGAPPGAAGEELPAGRTGRCEDAQDGKLDRGAQVPIDGHRRRVGGRGRSVVGDGPDLERIADVLGREGEADRRRGEHVIPDLAGFGAPGAGLQ